MPLQWRVVQSVIETNDNIIAVGDTSSTDAGIEGVNARVALIVKYTKSGEEISTEVFGGSGNEEFDAIIKMSDGGFLVAGGSNSTDAGFENIEEYDIIIAK